MSYLLKLQSEVFGAQNAMFKNLGHDLVLEGCAVTDNGNGTANIAPGIVYVDGEIIRFAGANNVVSSDASRCFVKGSAVVTDPDEFADESIKNTYSEVFAVIGNTSNALVQIIVKTGSLYGIRDYISDIIASYGQKGETKWVLDLDANFLENFDASGLGITPKWQGWHLMNGNAGVPSMAGRSPKGVGSFVDSYGLEHTYTNGAQGGQPRHKLTISELPKKNEYGGSPQTGGRPAFGGGPTVRWPTAYGEVGGDQPHNIDSPYTAGYWVIKIV